MSNLIYHTVTADGDAPYNARESTDTVMTKFVSCFVYVISIGNYWTWLTHLPLDKMAAILADNLFKCNFFNEMYCILILISLKFVLSGPITQTPVSGSCCLPLGALQSMWALGVKCSSKVNISVDKIFLFKLFFLGFFSVCLPNIYFNMLEYLSTPDLLSFDKSVL